MSTDPPSEPPALPLRLDFVWKHYRRYMEAALARLHVPAADVPDVLQNVMCAVARSLAAFVPRRGLPFDTALRIWLYRICLHKASDYHAAAASSRRALPLEAARSALAAVPSPDVLLEEREETQLLFELLSQLPPARQAVLLAYLPGDRTMAEVAQELSIAESTAWTRYYQAVEDVRAGALRRRSRNRLFAMPLWWLLFEWQSRPGGGSSGEPDSAATHPSTDRRDGSDAVRRRRGIRSGAHGTGLRTSLLITTVAVCVDVALDPVALGAVATSTEVHTTVADTAPAAPPPTPTLPPPASNAPPADMAPPARAPAGPASPTHREERAFLAAARAALAAGRTADACTALAAYRRRFPRGALRDVSDSLEARVSGGRCRR